MRSLKRAALLIAGMLGVAVLGFAEGDSDTTQAGQAAADVLQRAASSDGAFLAAGLMKDTFQSNDLSTALQYPTDEVVVLALKGSQIRQAFERSLSLYPHASSSTLHISGFEVVFTPDGDPGKRVVSVTAGTAKLDDSKVYSIAMPSQLARGGLGYFKIWDKNTKVAKTLPKSIEELLKNEKLVATKPRWIPQQ